MNRQQFRYICCSKCGNKWNIANITDTSHGYLCPKCRARKRRKSNDSVGNEGNNKKDKR